MVLFPNARITIYRLTPAGTVIGQTEGDPDAIPPVLPEDILLTCDTDGYDDITECYHPVGTYIGDLQAMSSNEITKDYGHVDQPMFKLNLDLGIDIRADDKVKASDYDGFFQVVGSPMQFKTLIPHIEVSLTKERI